MNVAALRSGSMRATERRLLPMAQGYQLSHALYVAAKLGVADLPADGALGPTTIAAAVGAPPATCAECCARGSLLVFTELDDGRIELNEAAVELQTNAPGRTRDVVVSVGGEMRRAFDELLHNVRTGATGFEVVYGHPLFEY